VRAFTAGEVAAIAGKADEPTALLVRTAATTGLRFGEIAGLEWKQLDIDKGVISVQRQFTHGAWSDLKSTNSRRRVPIAKELRGSCDYTACARQAISYSRYQW
jgi:integrase